MSVYAIVEDELVTNVIVWDGDESIWSPPEGATAIAIPEGNSVEIGDAYADGNFSSPLSPSAGNSPKSPSATS